MRRRGQVGVDLGSLLLDRVQTRAVAGFQLHLVDFLGERVARADGDITIVVEHQQAGVVAAADGQRRCDADGSVHLLGVRALIDDFGERGEHRRGIGFLPARPARHRRVG